MTHGATRTFGTGVRVRLPRGHRAVEYRARAFTLVEALVVLAILILIGGLALPGMTRWSSRYSDSAFESKIQTAIDSARAIAISNAAAVKIRIESRSGQSDRLTAAWHSSKQREDPMADRVKMLCDLEGSFSISIENAESSKTFSDSQVTLWTVLPDGSVTMTSGVKIERADGATATVAVGMWSGTLKLGSFVSEERPWYESADDAKSKVEVSPSGDSASGDSEEDMDQ